MVLEQLAAPGRAITEFILPLYRDTDFAYALAAVMVLMAAFILVIALFAHAFRMSAIGRRQRLLSQNITGPGTGPGGEGLSSHELDFREDFDRISTAMGASDAFATPLAIACSIMPCSSPSNQWRANSQCCGQCGVMNSWRSP